MTDASPVPAADTPSTPPDRSPAAPLLLWLVIQLTALSLAAFRVPLSARFPPAGERFAIHAVIVAQVLAAAMLFPFLMRDVRTSALVILTTAPFAQLASYLSAVPITRAALAALYVATWLATLALWRAMLPARRARMIGMACAVALSLGGAILWYVRAETRAGVSDWSLDSLFGPILGAIAQLHAPSLARVSWLVSLIVFIASATACFAIARVSRTRPS